MSFLIINLRGFTLKLKLIVSAMAIATLSSQISAAPVYSDFPVTVKGYEGNKTSSVSYGGQMARHTLHESLKVLASKGNGKANPELLAEMQSYFSGKDAKRKILAPISKDGFKVAQTNVDQLSKGKNLAGKTYPGVVSAWPGNKTAAEVLDFFILKASSSDAGFDYVNGMDYPQLISKFAMVWIRKFNKSSILHLNLKIHQCNYQGILLLVAFFLCCVKLNKV